MNKLLKIVAGILIALLFLLMGIPYLFKDKIIQMVKSEGNKMLNAKFDFNSIDLSFIRDFPKATITLNDFYLAGINEFEKDTLAKATSISATVNLMSIIGSSTIEIGKIELISPQVNAIINSEGKANWEIMKSDSSKTEALMEQQNDTPALQLALKKFVLEKAHIVFDDRQSKNRFALGTFNMELKGDFTAKQTAITTQFTIDGTDVVINNINYLKQALIKGDMNLSADLEQMKFTFEKNTLSLNAVQTGFQGWVMQTSKGWDMDLSLITNEINFKEIISLIPAIYAKNFESIQANGTVTLKAETKGKLEEELLPSFNVALKVDNGSLKYPDLPKDVRDIAIDLTANNPGGTADQTSVDINKFHFNMAGNPFDLQLKLKNPISDPDIHLVANGKINLGTVKEVYPLDSIDLSGTIGANMKVSGRYSYIEKEQYDLFNAEGILQVAGVDVKSNDFPELYIENMQMQFNPKNVILSETKIKIGRNDLTLTGSLDNLFAYVLKNEVLKGKLNAQSSYFNINDFLSTTSKNTSETTEIQKNDSIPAATIEIPKNINFDMQASFDELIFDNLVMKQAQGKLTIADGKLSIINLQTATLGGNIVVNGYYSTAKSIDTPEVNFNLEMKEISYAEAFKAFGLVQKMAPIFENINGSFSTKAHINTLLNNDFSPILSGLTGEGLLSSQNIKVEGIKVMELLAKTLKNDKLRNFTANDIKIPFEIKEGRIHTDPFDIKVGDIAMNLSGTTGLDQTIDYIGKVKLPSSMNIGGLVSSMNVKISGTFSDPKIDLGVADAAKDALNTIKDKAQDKLLNMLGVSKGEKESGISKEELAAEAKEKMDKLIANADSAGKRLIQEAEKAGKALEEKANNAITKAAAKVSASKLKSEAEKAAKKLKDEAEKSAKKIQEDYLQKGDSTTTK